MKIKYKFANEMQTIAPKKSTAGSAGFDLTACIESPMVIDAGQSVIIPTGIAIYIEDEGCVGLVFSRSGLALKHGITLSNGVGVIDSDYVGEIKVGLVNLSKKAYTVMPFDRIAQIVISPVIPVQLELETSLGKTKRGENGLGSTGK